MTTTIQRGFLLAEDEALKAKLSNITVVNPNRAGGRDRAKVWFRMPSGEREITYPYITIDLVDVVFAAERAHSAQITTVDYWPSEYATMAEYAAANGITFDDTMQLPQATEWHPYDLYYQVATHARFAQHDREMMATLLGTAYLPDRWGYLDVPADGSSRYLEREGYATDDFLETTGQTSKRVFRKVYNVKVSAQLPPENPFFFWQVLQVAGTLKATNDSNLQADWVNEPAP